MDLMLFSGSWSLLFLVLLMWAVIIIVPVALIIWVARHYRRKRLG